MLKRLIVTSLLASAAGSLAAGLSAQQPAALPGASAYLIFLGQRPIGREEAMLINDAEGWTVRGSSQIGPPIDVTTRRAEIRYDPAWNARSLVLEGITRGQDAQLRTTFADGMATSEIIVQGKSEQKVDPVSADTIVLANTFLSSYMVLAQRLQGLAPGAELKGYIAPQIEIPIRLASVTDERMDTARASIPARRYSLKFVNPPPGGELDVMVWADERGQLLRMSVPAQQLELAREDIASAATRTTSFSLPGDERVQIPAAGFNLAGTLTRPANATGRLPAVVLIGGSGPTDRDETVAGIPIFGQLAEGLVDAGFIVVRYDKRGVGQSGGRAESAALADYAEDARAVVRWLERHPNVDRDRIALVGHSEGAAVAMMLGARENRVKAVVLVAGPGTSGAELILEQQRHALDLMKVDATERAAKIAMQEQIQAAVLKGAGWDGVPDNLRRAADTPWFQSMLSFDPARVMKDVDQPVLIVQGELDTQVPPHHADKLLAMAQARKKEVDAQVLKVPGVNHLLVPAKTGEVTEYSSLSNARVAPAIPAGIGAWLARVLGPGRK